MKEQIVNRGGWKAKSFLNIKDIDFPGNFARRDASLTFCNSFVLWLHANFKTKRNNKAITFLRENAKQYNRINRMDRMLARSASRRITQHLLERLQSLLHKPDRFCLLEASPEKSRGKFLCPVQPFECNKSNCSSIPNL